MSGSFPNGGGLLQGTKNLLRSAFVTQVLSLLAAYCELGMGLAGLHTSVHAKITYVHMYVYTYLYIYIIGIYIYAGTVFMSSTITIQRSLVVGWLSPGSLRPLFEVCKLNSVLDPNYRHMLDSDVLPATARSVSQDFRSPYGLFQETSRREKHVSRDVSSCLPPPLKMLSRSHKQPQNSEGNSNKLRCSTPVSHLTLKPCL